MKKLLATLLILSLIAFSASAEIRLAESVSARESKTAAAEFGAVDAYFSPTSDNIYFLTQTGEGYSVTLLGEKGDYETVHKFSSGSAYVCIRAASDGNIYLIKQQADESLKSAIVCLIRSGEGYVETEYPFPGASCDLIPRRFEFSPESASGCVMVYMNIGGQYVPMMSIFNILWGALEGYDAFIAIQPGASNAEVVPMASYFDAYGYAGEEAQALAGLIARGELLSPTDACISPSGDKVLVTVPYMDSTLIYVIDIYSLSLQLVYPPDGFSGTVGWNEDDTLYALSDSGETASLTANSLDSAWEDSWADTWTEDDSWSTLPVDDWGSAS